MIEKAYNTALNWQEAMKNLDIVPTPQVLELWEKITEKTTKMIKN